MHRCDRNNSETGYGSSENMRKLPRPASVQELKLPQIVLSMVRSEYEQQSHLAARSDLEAVHYMLEVLSEDGEAVSAEGVSCSARRAARRPLKLMKFYHCVSRVSRSSNVSFINKGGEGGRRQKTQLASVLFALFSCSACACRVCLPLVHEFSD